MTEKTEEGVKFEFYSKPDNSGFAKVAGEKSCFPSKVAKSIKKGTQITENYKKRKKTILRE